MQFTFAFRFSAGVKSFYKPIYPFLEDRVGHRLSYVVVPSLVVSGLDFQARVHVVIGAQPRRETGGPGRNTPKRRDVGRNWSSVPTPEKMAKYQASIKSLAGCEG